VSSGSLVYRWAILNNWDISKGEKEDIYLYSDIFINKIRGVV